MSAGSKLYTTQMLSLSAELANYPYSEDFELTADARSSVCGSTISIGLDLDGSGIIRKTGLRVAACAVGQSSAAILARNAAGARAEDISRTREGLRAWLSDEGPLPDWPDLEVLSGVREHKGRHGALLLPWDAAAKALGTAE